MIHRGRRRIYLTEQEYRTHRSAVERLQAFVLIYLRHHPCVDCGETDTVVLDFDHRPGTKKYLCISQMVSGASDMRDLIVEIAKCDIRCANCHRRATFRRKGWTHRGEIQAPILRAPDAAVG